MAAAALLLLKTLQPLALRQIKNFKRPNAGRHAAQSRLAITRSVLHMRRIGAPKVGAGL
jgi:hypothetical protein